MKSSRIVFTGPERVEIVEEELGDPGPGEVTIQTLVSLVSTGTELICYRGSWDSDTHWSGFGAYPLYPGYCTVGSVIAAGDGATGLQEGDRICVTVPHRDLANICATQIWSRPLPDAVTDEEAAWAVLGVITQTGVRHCEHVMGDTALIIGLGPLGQLVTQYLRALGLQEVLVVDPIQTRLDVALDHGATAGFCGSASEAKDFVLEHTEGRLVDVVYDVTGHYAVLPMALPLARDFGKVILLGDSPHPSRQNLTDDILNRQLKLIGTRSSTLPPQYEYWTPIRQAQLFLDYVQRGQMRVADLITHRLDPRNAVEAYRTLYADRRETLGVLFDWRQ